MAEVCPGTCTNYRLKEFLGRRCTDSEVVREVTGYDMSYSLGVPIEDADDPASHTLAAASVYTRDGQASVDAEDLKRVNEVLLERYGEWFDQRRRVEGCAGLVWVQLGDKVMAEVCEAELKPF